MIGPFVLFVAITFAGQPMLLESPHRTLEECRAAERVVNATPGKEGGPVVLYTRCEQKDM